MARSAMDWAEESDQPLILLLLDFEKTYDRVSWKFLQQTMIPMGFPLGWVELVMSLYNEATASVVLNGTLGEPFSLQRSVRQGRPLAPYLYLIAADVNGHMVDDPARSLIGLTLPDGRKTDNQMYADDAALYLHGNVSNLDTTMRILTTYRAGCGARINWRKSNGIWASQTPRD